MYQGIDFDSYEEALDEDTDGTLLTAEGAVAAQIRRNRDGFTVTFPAFAAFDAPGGTATEYRDAFTFAAVVVDAVNTEHHSDPTYLEDVANLAAIWTADELVTAYSALLDARTGNGTTLPVLDIIDRVHKERTGNSLT